MSSDGLDRLERVGQRVGAQRVEMAVAAASRAAGGRSPTSRTASPAIWSESASCGERMPSAVTASMVRGPGRSRQRGVGTGEVLVEEGSRDSPRRGAGRGSGLHSAPTRRAGRGAAGPGRAGSAAGLSPDREWGSAWPGRTWTGTCAASADGSGQQQAYGRQQCRGLMGMGAKFARKLQDVNWLRRWPRARTGGSSRRSPRRCTRS